MILVTGASGLLGSHLLVALAEKGRPLRALYRNQKRLEQTRKIFHFYHPEKGDELFHSIEWQQCDVCDVVCLEEFMQGCEFVYHCAALVSFARRDFHRMLKYNREGTANVVNCALATGVRKLIYVSSTAAVGSGEGEKILNENATWKPSQKISGYAISKYGAEKEVWRGIEEGLKAVMVNPSLIVGAGNWNESSLTIFRTIDKGLRFITPGANAYVDARDVAEIMIRLGDSDIQNERFLLIGENLSFKEAFGRIARKLKRPVPNIQIPKWMATLARRFNGFVSFFTRKNPVITKETVRSAYSTQVYSNQKITERLNYTFKTFDEMVDNAIAGRIK